MIESINGYIINLVLENISENDRKELLNADRNSVVFRTLLQKHIQQVTINVFHEYSMTNARPISEFTGFTEQEVLDLCDKYRMSSESFKQSLTERTKIR